MKRKLQLIMSASAASVLAFTVLAQDTTNPNRGLDRAEYGRQRLAQPQADRLNGAAKASDLIGMEVKNYQDEKLGKVEDLAVDVESGRVIQVILSTGGFIGIGDRLTAVPPAALHHDVVQKVLHLDANQEKLKSAPEFEMSKWAESSDSQHLSAVYRHFGQESALTFVQRDGAMDNQRPNAAGQRQTNNQRLNAEGQRQTENQRNNRDQQQNANDQRNLNAGQRPVDSSPNTVSTRRADGSWEQDRIPGQSQASQSVIPAARLGQIQKASKLIGTDVKNLQDEKLGDVENLLVDLSSGRIVAVIVSTGGFLGIDDELSAVPASALKYTTDRDTLQLDTTKEKLSQAPHFKSNQWPDFNKPDYARDIHRAYNVQPYFTTGGTTDEDSRRNVRDRDDQTPTTRQRDNSDRTIRDRDDQTPSTRQPDNSERNVRDRDDQTLTPFNQGNSKADVDTTAQIRKAITAADGLSVNAQNVKIITQSGRVTLRGPVNTAEEKRLIGEIANRITTTGNVDNQLEVKRTTSDN